MALKPTVIRGNSCSLEQTVLPVVSTPSVAALQLPSSFPIALSTEQRAEVAQQLAGMDFVSMSRRDISLSGNAIERALTGTLDGFLEKITEFDNPRLFQLVVELKEKVDQEQLPELADRILNGQPGMFTRLKCLFNKQALLKAMDEAWTETKRVASGKTKTLVDLLKSMDRDLQREQQKLEGEVNNMEALKEAYRGHYDDFVVTVALHTAFLAQAKAYVAQVEQTTNLNDLVQKAALDELRDKLEALESRTLSLEGTLTRIPGDQLVIRQLQNAGIATLQETATTTTARFASIKMTLLSIHKALITKGVQQLLEQGATLDATLMSVRGRLVQDVVTKAANAPGESRLEQARKLQGIVAETKVLMGIVDEARIQNQAKFAQARKMFADARQEMLTLGQQIQPNRSLRH